MPDLEVPDSRGGSVSQASRASKFRQLDLNGDGVIDNVNGMTMDAKGQMIHFTGIVIGRDGKVVGRYASGIAPDNADFVADIEHELAKK